MTRRSAKRSPDDLLTINQAAAILAEWYPTTFRRLDAGELRFEKHDGRRMVRRREVWKLASRRAAAKLSHVALIALHAVAHETGIPVEALLAGDLASDEQQLVEKVWSR